MEAGVFYDEQSIADAKEQAEKEKAEEVRENRKDILREASQESRRKILLGMSKAHKLSQIIEKKKCHLGFFVIYWSLDGFQLRAYK